MRELCEIVREAEDNLQDSVKLGDYVEHSMCETIETIDAYSNSKHINGKFDSLGREKPFFNVVTAPINIYYRATDLDRKDIKFIPKTSSAVPLAFIANVLLQNWMDDNRLGKFLNQWGRSLAKYGSSVVKFVEKNGKLIPSVVPWNRIICDQVDFDALPRIEKFYKTPAQLRQIKEYDQDVVDGLLNALTARKTGRGRAKDLKNDFVELYEIHGEMDARLLQDDPDLDLKDKDIKYVQQMHVVSFVKNGKEYKDFTLYKGRETQDPYMLTHLIEEEGRTLSIGSVEIAFDAQWMQNHTVKNMKDTLDLTSKLIMQTADPRYTGKNVLTAIETGEIFTHALNMPLTRVANDNPSITALQNFGVMWQNMLQQLSNTPDLTRGITQAQPLTYGLGQIINQNSNSLFEIMTESKGLHLEDMIRTYVIPHLKKQLKNKDEIVGILDDAGIQEIDAMYIPKRAVEMHNENFKRDVLNGVNPMPFDQTAMEGMAKQEMNGLGNKRFFVPDKASDKQWAEVFSDFQWDNVRVEITSENVDKQAVMQTLSSVFQSVASNPMILQDPTAKMLFNQILQETGRISPLQLTSVAPSGGAPSAVGAEALLATK